MIKILALLFCIFLILPLQAQQIALRRKVKLPQSLVEVSGLTRTPDGGLWALADGGNVAALYRLNPSNGHIEQTIPLPLENIDWEDLTTDPATGCLWIGDFGNNRNDRKDLRIYRYCPTDGSIESLSFVYPDQYAFPPATETAQNFDCEAFVCYRDTLHLFTKSRFKGRHFTKHYVVPAKPGVYQLQLIDSIYLKKRVVSGAGISTDGRTLALTAYYVEKKWGFWPVTRASVFFLTKQEQGNWFQGKVTRKRLPKALIARQFESVTYWKDNTWLAANEGILWQKPHLWRIRTKKNGR